MIVVADTSPITNLLLIGKLELLSQVFGRVVIPGEVEREILALANFGFDLQPFKDASWIESVEVEGGSIVSSLTMTLDKGEAEAISLAKELEADWLLIDERKGTVVAKSIGLQTIGVLGVLLSAKRSGYVQTVMLIVHDLIEKAGFWLSKDVLDRIAKEANE